MTRTRRGRRIGRAAARLLGTGIAAGLASASPAAAQPWPFRTEDPRLVDAGAVAARAALELGTGVDLPASGLSGTALRAPVALRFGFGRAEFQLDGGYEALSIEERSAAPLDSMLDVSGDWTHDVVDPVVGFKVRIAEEAGVVPAWSFRVATRLPAAGNESGLGLDTSDFWLWLLSARSVGRARVVANIGAGVLGIPTRGDRQNDVWGYGLSIVGRVGSGWEAGAEVQGSLDVRGDTPVGTEARGQARIGIRRASRRFTVDAAVVVGLEEADPDLGAIFGLATTFVGAFRP